MATELGLGSCWVQVHMRKKDGVYAEEVVRDILKVDSHYRIAGILAIGHSDDIPQPHTLEDIDKSKIHFLV
jgi:nitroreductase